MIHDRPPLEEGALALIVASSIPSESLNVLSAGDRVAVYLGEPPVSGASGFSHRALMRTREVDLVP